MGKALFGFLFALCAQAYSGENNNIHKVLMEQKSLETLEQSYSVLIYGDPMVFNHFRVGAEIRRIEKSFQKPVLAYEASNKDELIKILKNLSDKRVLIQNLVTRGIHGYNIEGVPGFEVVDYRNDDFAIVEFEDFEQANIKLRFTSSAFIFMDACDLVDTKSEVVLQRSFDQFTKIGFKTGWIYLNDSLGAYAFAGNFLVPFWESYGGLKEKFRHFMFQVVGWPVVAPLFYYKDRTETNIGYLMGVSENHKVILSTRSEKVINGKIVGKLVYER